MSMTDLRTELEPCPFCGGKAALTEVEPSGYIVECTNGVCNASTNVRYSCGEDARPLVIEQWNRRTYGRALVGALAGWQPIETAPHGVFDTIIGGFVMDEENYQPPSREMFWSVPGENWRLTSDPQWNSCPQPTHWMPLPQPPQHTARDGGGEGNEG